MRQSAIVLGAVLLLLVAAVPVAAVAPVENSGPVNDDFYLFSCPQGFDVYDYDVGQWTERVYFDQAGVPVGSVGHKRGVDTLHREHDLSVVLAHSYSLNWKWNAATDDLKFSGSVFNVHLPQTGLVFKSSGMGIFDDPNAPDPFKRAGLEYFDIATACEYLAPKP